MITTSLSIFTILHWYNSTTPKQSKHSPDSRYRLSSATPSLEPATELSTSNWPQDGHVNTFTDLLADLRAFGPDKEYTEAVSGNEDELSGDFDNSARPTESDLPKPVQHETTKQEQVIEKPSWLFDNPRIRVSPEITEDVMPDYFDPDGDATSQFERYHDLTRAIIDKRLETLEQGCSQRIRKYMKHEQDFIFYFPEMNLGWCPVFKAGSTNWKQFFCKIYLPDVYNEWKVKTDKDPYCPLGELIGFSVRNRELELKERDRHEPDFNGLETWGNLKNAVSKSVKFLTVRHPYQRLVSMYTNKFKDCVSHMFSNTDGIMVRILQLYRKTDEKFPPAEKARLIEAARIQCRKPVDKRQIDKNNPYMNPMGATFKEVMQFIISNFKNGVWPDFHWVQVTKSCDVCSKKYSVIEKFETIERDHYFLLKTIGEEARYPEIAGSHGNPSASGRNPHELVIQYFSQLDEYILWDLQAVYKDDFYAFGYTPHFRVIKNPYIRNSNQ